MMLRKHARSFVAPDRQIEQASQCTEDRKRKERSLNSHYGKFPAQI